MDGGHRAGVGEVEREVAVGDRVDAVRGQTIEAQLARDDIALQGQRRRGQRSRTERHLVRGVVGVPKTCRVATQWLGVGQQVMPDGHRLRPLQMRVPGHEPIGVRLGLVRQRIDEVGEADRGFDRRIAAEQPQVERHLVVARRARDLRDAPLDRGVDVLVLQLEVELVAVQLTLDLPEPATYRGKLAGREDARRGQPACVREAHRDVVRIELVVDRQ